MKNDLLVEIDNKLRKSLKKEALISLKKIDASSLQTSEEKAHYHYLWCEIKSVSGILLEYSFISNIFFS